MMMIRFWFEFEFDESDFEKYSSYAGLGYGCGVTAYTLDDAKALMRSRIFRDDPFPTIANLTENVDVSTLDPGHVLPNIGIVVDRGVWYPNLGK